MFATELGGRQYHNSLSKYYSKGWADCVTVDMSLGVPGIQSQLGSLLQLPAGMHLGGGSGC